MPEGPKHPDEPSCDSATDIVVGNNGRVFANACSSERVCKVRRIRQRVTALPSASLDRPRNGCLQIDEPGARDMPGPIRVDALSFVEV